MNNKKSNLFVFTFLLVLSCAMFSSTLFTDRVMVPTDQLKIYYPWKLHLKSPTDELENPALFDGLIFYGNQKYLSESLRAGRVPLWNPHQAAGLPFAGAGWGAAFYPVNTLLTIFFTPGDVFEISAALHTFLAGFFMFLMLRVFRCGKESALLGAVAFMFTGWLQVFTMYPMFFSAAAWGPAVILFLELALRRGSWKMAALAGVCQGMVFLTGCPQVAAYILIACGLLAAGHALLPEKNISLLRRIFHPAAASAVVIVTGLAVAAVQVVPTLGVLFDSNRKAGVPDTALMDRYYHLVTLFLPDLFGNVSKGKYLPPHGMAVEAFAYLGAGVTLLAFMAWAVRRDRAVLVWTLIAACGVAGATGIIPFYKLPLFSGMRMNRMLVLLALAGPPMAALAWDALLKRSVARKQNALSFDIGVILFSVAAAGGALAVLWKMTMAQNEIPHADFEGFIHPAFLRLAIASVFVPAAILLRRNWRSGATALLIITIAADLMSWGWGFNPAGKPDLLFPKTPSVRYLQENAGDCRIHGFYRVFFLPNTATIFNLYDVRGDEPIPVNRYSDLVGALNAKVLNREQTYNAIISPATFDAPMLRLMNVCYYLTTMELPGERFTRVHLSDTFVMYDNTVMERAVFFDRWRVEADPEKIKEAVISFDFQPEKELLLEEDPGLKPGEGGGEVRITKYEPEEITIEVEARAPGLVFLGDPWAAGWDAEVDGAPARLLKADYAFRAVAVDAGKHQVIIRYRPITFRIGSALTLTAIFLLMAAFGASAFKQRKS